MGLWEWLGWETPPPPARPTPSKKLQSTKGTYEIGSKLGEGGMGEVYKARFTSKDGKTMDVALKKMKFDSSTYALCKREVELMAKISDSNTSTNNVKMYDGFSSNLEVNTLCIAMEYCELGDLAGRIKKMRDSGQQFEQKLIYTYMYDIANGIDELHVKHRIVHRDIKPQNILISFDWPSTDGPKREVLKISDYGICKLANIVAETAGPTNTLIMTPFYAAPEQLAHYACDKPADIWAIGMIFYELCMCPTSMYSIAADARQKVKQGKKLVLPSRFPQKVTK